MEEHLIDYLIYEGYANTESSAYKILSVISEEFYEYLLYEALTPEQRAAGRARTARRRKETGIPEKSPEETAATMGRIRQRGARTSSDRPASTTMTTHTGASVNKPSRALQTRAERDVESTASNILAKDRSETGDNENRPTADPTFVNAQGRRQSLNVVVHPGQSYTYRRAKETMGQPAVQGYDDPNRDIGVGPTSSRGGTELYSGRRPSGSSETSSKKPQTSQPQPPQTTPSGRPVRVRTLPSQAQTTPKPTRATSARRNPSKTVADVTPRQLQTGKRGKQQILGIQRQNPQ